MDTVGPAESSGPSGVPTAKQVAASRPAPPMAGGMSHLDLIKSGQFKLRKVEPIKKQEPPPPKEIDPSGLSMQELLQRMAVIRAATKPEEDSDSGEEEDEETSSWE